MGKAIVVKVESDILAKTIEHYRGDLDKFVIDITNIAMGDYESVIACKNWSDKQRVYTRNGFRKYASDRIKEWLKGENDLICSNLELKLKMSQAESQES